MAYNKQLVAQLRLNLSHSNQKNIVEQQMFRGLMFMVNDKMCIGVSGDNLLCRFDPLQQEEVTTKTGFQPMVMKGKILKGYCYVNPAGFQREEDFQYWVSLCLAYNPTAKRSKKKKAATAIERK